MTRITHDRDMAWLNREIAQRVDAGHKTLFKMEAMSFAEACLDPEIAEHAGGYILQSFETAMDISDDPIACYCCDRKWATGRVPVMAVWISFVATPPIEGALLAGVCKDCTAKGYGEVARVAKRDFPYLADSPAYVASRRPGNA
jgi:hypothetical protein